MPTATHLLSVTTTAEITSALAMSRFEADLNSKAGLVSEVFREYGLEPVVVGGSAIEF
jgi:hypothetical protein